MSASKYRCHAQKLPHHPKNNNMQPYTETLETGIFFTMQPIAGGSFMMGSNEEEREKPIHEVTLSNFYICEHAVTQAVWQAIMGSNPSSFKDEQRPVERVSWLDAQEFIKKLNAWEAQHPNPLRPRGYYCLPTEAQWEYAARGGQQSEGFVYAGSDKLEEVGYYARNSANQTRRVGQLHPNELGLYDMSGNVYEWCQDEWHANYKGAPADGSAWQGKSNAKNENISRVVRGGSWYSVTDNCRVASRLNHYVNDRFNYLGFRLSRCLTL